MLSRIERALMVSERAIRTWGEGPEERMVYEELAELQLALCHYKRGKATRKEVVDEIADAVLVAIHAGSFVGAEAEELVDAVDRKLERTERRVKGAEEDG